MQSVQIFPAAIQLIHAEQIKRIEQ